MSDQILILLAGALFGSYFTHIFQKKSWLYQTRIESFAKLMEIIHVQREKAATYAFSKTISEKEKADQIEHDFLPVWTQYYLTSFMLSDEGNTEVKDILSGFEGRLRDLEHHFASQSNEFLGFHHEVKRLHSCLQMEATASSFARAVWYAQLRKHRQNFSVWLKNELPKLGENLVSDILANIRASQPRKPG